MVDTTSDSKASLVKGIDSLFPVIPDDGTLASMPKPEQGGLSRLSSLESVKLQSCDMSIDELLKSFGTIPNLTKSTDSVSMLTELLKSNSLMDTEGGEESKTDDSRMQDLLKLTKSSESMGMLNSYLQGKTRSQSDASDDNHDYGKLMKAPLPFLASTDWMPKDAAKQIDDSVIQGLLVSASSAKKTDWNKLYEKAALPTAKKTDWNKLFDSKLPVQTGSTKTDWNKLYAAKLPPNPVKQSDVQKVEVAKKTKEEEDEWLPEDAKFESVPKSVRLKDKEEGKKMAPKKKKVEKRRKRVRAKPNYEPQEGEKEICEPKDDDVLLGRGGKSNHHPGNKRYLEAKEDIQPRYLAASKEAKTGISQELVDIVENWGGRFLKEDEDGNWYRVRNIVARKKASQTLREFNTKENRAKKRAKYGK